MASTFNGYWNVNSPAAATSLTSWTPGFLATYEIDIYAYNAGTLLLTDADNIGVYVNGTLVTKIPVPSTINLPPAKITVFVFADVTDAITVKTIAAGGLLSTYRGLMVGRLAQY